MPLHCCALLQGCVLLTIPLETHSRNGYNIAMLTSINSIHNTVCDAFSEVNSIVPSLLRPLTLAYIGDTVFDLYIRSYLLHFSNAKVHGLHMRAIKSVCAQAQAKAYEIISPTLSEDEKNTILGVAGMRTTTHINL